MKRKCIILILNISLSYSLNFYEMSREFYRHEWGPYLEGDIIVTPTARMGYVGGVQNWFNKTVPYKFSHEFEPNRYANILNSMEKISNLTDGCITFIERTTEEDYVEIVSDSGCGSSIGRVGGSQILDLRGMCSEKLDIILHELFHVLGFSHEHRRPDRDDYVTIIFENIIEDLKPNFDKNMNMTTFGVGYDYKSIVHYDRFTWSKDGNFTIITKDPSYQYKIGNYDDLSEKDILKLKKRYQC